MGFIADGPSPETFLVEQFQQNHSPITVKSGSATDRIPVIRLLICPQDWQVMNANVVMYSTRYLNNTHVWGRTRVANELVLMAEGRGLPAGPIREVCLASRRHALPIPASVK